MGLSNGERNTYIFNAIKNIVALSKNLKHDDFDEIKQHINMLWPSTIGSTSNGLHWIVGSSATNQIGWDDFSVFSVALKDGFDDDKAYIEENEHKKKDPNYKSMREIRNDYFDPMDKLGIKDLIENSDSYLAKEYSIIYEIFAWTEQLVYALRRYDDEYRRGLSKLSEVIASIQGDCFPFFSNVVFRQAYLSYHMFNILFHKREIEDAIKNLYLFHDVSGICRDHQIDSIMGFHKRLTIDSSPAECIYLLLEIAGRHFHYDHKYKELVNALKKANIKIDYKKLAKIFSANCKKHSEREKESSEKYGKEKEADHFYCVHGKFLDDIKQLKKEK